MWQVQATVGFSLFPAVPRGSRECVPGNRLSIPSPGRRWTRRIYRAGGPQLRVPVANADGARLRRLNAEHAIVDIVDPAFSAQPGDLLELWAHYSDATVNLHRRMLGVRDGLVEETFLVEG